MKIGLGSAAGTLLLTVTGLVCLSVSSARIAQAQEKQATVRQTRVAAPRLTAYVTSREIVVQGIVGKFEEASKDAPIGAHVKVQTASGIIDVHLGPNSYLRDNHFSLAAGDAVRVAGAQTLLKGRSVVLARIIQRGSDTLTVRTPRGFVVGLGSARLQAAKNGPKALGREGAR